MDFVVANWYNRTVFLTIMEKALKENPPSDQTRGIIRVFNAIMMLAVAGAIGFFVYTNTYGENPSHPFRLGLDLAGGSHLIYEADVSGLDPSEVPALSARGRA